VKVNARKISTNLVLVTTDWTTYHVIFSDDNALVTSTGLEQEFSISFFPDQASNIAIAMYLVGQLELDSIGG
jgi:hypothetical protein